MASSMTVYGEGVVVSSPTNGSPNFIPMTQWIRASEVLNARATLEMRGQSNSCQINGAYQTSNDQITLSAPTSLIAGGSYLTAEGYQYPTAFQDISASTNGAGWVRFGLQCQPAATGGGVAGCWASLRIDTQGA